MNCKRTQTASLPAKEFLSLGLSILVSLLFLYLSATGYNMYYSRFVISQSDAQIKSMGAEIDLQMRYERAVNKKIERLV